MRWRLVIAALTGIAMIAGSAFAQICQPPGVPGALGWGAFSCPWNAAGGGGAPPPGGCTDGALDGSVAGCALSGELVGLW